MSGRRPHTYRVGQPYAPGRRSWPEGIDFHAVSAGYVLRLFLSRPTREEIEAFRQGEVELRLFAQPHVGVLVARFGVDGSGIPWSDVPFHVGLQTEAEGRPDAETNLLHLFLVDAADGILRGMRAVGLASGFAGALYQVVSAQLTLDMGQHRAAVAQLQRHSSAQLAEMASARLVVPARAGTRRR